LAVHQNTVNTVRQLKFMVTEVNPVSLKMQTRIAFLTIVLLACCQPQKKIEWQFLFNDSDLTGWDTYLGPAYDTLNHKFDSVPGPGLNNDPDQVFRIVSEDNQPAIRISGQHFGGLSTLAEFSNYHLQLEFKWGKTKWPPNHARKRDSGLLYHAVGPHGADYNFWMRSQEFQIQEGDCGDYWGVAGGVMDVNARGEGVEQYTYDHDSPLLTFSGTSANGRRCIKNPDAEKPTGEWNVLDLYCLGDTAIHVVNGIEVMRLYNSRQSENGTETPLTKGKIQLQSEGAEVFFRRIQIKSISEFPKK
jgi:hypothetical protein